MKRDTLIKVALIGGPATLPPVPFHAGGGDKPIVRSGANIAIEKSKKMQYLIQRMKGSPTRLEKSQRFNNIKSILKNPSSKIKL